MTYKNCVHSKQIPGTENHVCQRNPKPVVKLNKTAKRLGWTSFPEKINPFFTEYCSGYETK